MKQLEKWQQAFSEAQNGEELLSRIREMEEAHKEFCYKKRVRCKYLCNKCKVDWLDSEIKESNKRL